VTDAFSRGAQAWPDIHLPPEELARYLAARGLPTDAPHSADLYLVCACLLQMPSAMRAFERSQLRELDRHVARLRLSPELLDELAQQLREKLLMPPKPRLAEYSGRSKLLVWMRVVSMRAAIDLLRARGDLPTGDAEAHELPAATTSPELTALRSRYKPRFEQAFADALAAVPDEQRRLLRMHFVDGMTLEAIAQRLGVNRSTIMRRLDSCTDALWAGLRERLGGELGLDTGELNSLRELLQSDLELSLGKHLKTRP
jgi:RNA polymerase sigma-70 factor (ECF subfamily)